MNDRQTVLVQMLSQKESITVTELSQALDSSLMTIRRDLDFLEEQGIVKRFHGGAKLATNGQPSFYKKASEISDEKKRLGAAAAKLISQGSIVFFDAGTSVLAIAEFIPKDLEFTAVTTGLLMAAALCDKPKINLIYSGGEVHHASYSSVGYIAVSNVKNYHADMAFISTNSISIPEGISETYLSRIEIKRAIVEAADRVVLLVDSSKFLNRSLQQSIDMRQIHVLITDEQLDSEQMQILNLMGIQVIIA